MVTIARRKLLAALAGAAAWPIAARAQQQAELRRRVAALIGWPDTGSYHANFVAFIERLAQFGWIDGRNLQIEQRWTNANAERTPALAKELSSHVATRRDLCCHYASYRVPLPGD
jgi:putative ABC transport system substrate-binding protein